MLRKREPITKEQGGLPVISENGNRACNRKAMWKGMCIWGVGRKSVWVQLESGNTKVGVQSNDEISICVASKGKDAYSRRRLPQIFQR